MEEGRYYKEAALTPAEAAEAVAAIADHYQIPVVQEAEAPARRGKFPCVVRARVSIETRAKLDEAAELAGLSIGRFIRYRLDGTHVPDRSKLRLMNELRRLGGLQKLLASQGHPTGSIEAEIRQTLKTIQQEQ